MEAAETWHHDKLDGISWIISGDKQVDEDTKALVSMRDSGAQHLQVAKSILACESGLSGAINAKLKNLLAKLSYVSTDMEDRLGVFFQNWDFHVRKKRSNKNQKITEGCVFSFLDHSVSATLLSLSRCVYIGGDAFQHSNGFVFDDVLGSDHQQGKAWRPSGGFKKGLQLYVQKTWRFS